MTQQIILPVACLGYSVLGQHNEWSARGEIRMTATLNPPNGAVSIEIDVRDEDNRMVRNVRYAFPPSELITNAKARQLPCARCGQSTKRRNGS
jgi:hypothetical protein